MYPVNNVEPLLLFPNSRPGWDAGLKKKSRDLDWPWAFTYRKFYKGLGWGAAGVPLEGRKQRVVLPLPALLWPGPSQVLGGSTGGQFPVLGLRGSPRRPPGPDLAPELLSPPLPQVLLRSRGVGTPPPRPLRAGPCARAAPGGRLRSHREIVSRRNLTPEPQARTTLGQAH